MPLPPDAVWFVSGCSTGFGRALAEAVIARGWRLVATARDEARVADLASETVLTLALDVTDQAQIDAAVVATNERFGRIDVLVNNAGYGYQASVEEGEEREVRAQFDVNVFGLFALTRAVLPEMRMRRFGRIVSISSVVGFTGFAGGAFYAASKHAIEGWSDALLAEVGTLGIGVTCVEPGRFRTDFAGRSLEQTATRIDDYRDIVGARVEALVAASGKQPGDPARAAQAIIAATERDDPPRHLVLGKDAYEVATTTLAERLHAIERQRDTAFSTDFPDA